MVIAFGGVIVIGTAKPIEDQDNKRSYEDGKLLGLCFSLTMTFCYSLQSVLTRKM
jgi:drug/metabolite transporter (DMT)-like permease